MTLFSLTECCALLAIDPKTFRRWIQQAHVELTPHPTDARIKYVTAEQIQQLAILHHRVLQPQPVAFPDPSTEVSAETPLRTISGTEMGPALAQTEAWPCLPEVDWAALFAPLETYVAALQAHLARLQSLCVQDLSPLDGAGSPEQKSKRARRPHPAESRRRRALPLIEYGAEGRYVVICPQEGELALEPDSPEWFTWFASLGSFRFLGQQGRLWARRGYDHETTRYWYATRTIHQRVYRRYLGGSETLTIAPLEQMAANLQASVTVQ